MCLACYASLPVCVSVLNCSNRKIYGTKDINDTQMKPVQIIIQCFSVNCVYLENERKACHAVAYHSDVFS